MRRIVWVTPDSFIDCDNNPEILSEILKVYAIHWIVILPTTGARFKESDFFELQKLPNLTIEFLYSNYRARDPRTFLFYENLYKRIKKGSGDLVYFNNVPSNPYILPLYWRLNKRNTIFTAHDGGVNKAFKFYLLSKMTFQLAFGFSKYINMFSSSQAKLFKTNFGNKNIFIIPLSLKDFGTSSFQRKNNIVRFGFFGTIHYGKNLGLLIDAACALFEDGVSGFKIHIDGSCGNWDEYQNSMKYPELFENNIRHIDNMEIADIFSKSHYMVFPYRVMSQSGALKVAFNYNIPVIVSDLDGFKDEVIEDVNGYFFKSEDIEDLKNRMKYCVQNFHSDYETLYNKMKEYNDIHNSNAAISRKYLQMFNSVLAAQY